MLSTYFQIACQNCKSTKVLSVLEMHQQLTRLGKLKKQSDPETEILLELYRSTPETARCVQCQQNTLIIAPVRDEFDDLTPRQCAGCGEVIAAERLEVFPDITTCPACASRDDTDQDYCLLCGDLMSIVSSSRHGLTRYVSRCTGCGHEN